MLAARQLKRQTWAASVIQAQWRYRAARKKYAQLLAELERRRQTSATVIQKNWRAYVELQKFLRLRRRVVVVQAAVRAYLARKRFLAMKASATIISSHYKGFQARRNYLKDRERIIVVQSAVRRLERFARSIFPLFLAVPGKSGLYVKQLHGYSGGSTCFGVIISGES